MNNKWKLNYDTDEMLQRLYNSKLYKLACIQLKREGKYERVKLKDTIIYPVNVGEAILKGFEILKTANKSGIKI